MRSVVLLVLLACGILSPSLAVAASSPPDPNDPKWGCYDPAPGHPTDQERHQFVAAASDAARQAEKQYGVPAPVLAAMAIVESGYGTTRTALFANNFFGFKDASQGSQSYQLTCQPLASDPNNHYLKFASLEDSMLFVAKRLATSGIYKADTKRYQADLKAGVGPAIAARLWLDVIAVRYNGNPPKYRHDLHQMMNDPYRPSDTVDSATTLYALAPAAPAVSPYANLTASVAYKAAIKAEGADLDPGHRYADHCIEGSGNTVPDYPGYEGYPVIRCIYKEGTLTGLAYTLHPSKEQLASWIAYACIRAMAADQAACAAKLFDDLWGSNNAQYPVAGNIIEDGAAAGCDKPKVYYNLQFRDGVTVKLHDHVCFEDAQSIDKQQAEASASIDGYRFASRISGLYLDQYQGATGKTLPTGETPTRQTWGYLSRFAQLTAIDDGVNLMLNIQAERQFGH